MGQRRRNGSSTLIKRAGLRLKLTIMLVGVTVLLLGFNVVWGSHSRQMQAEREMLEKAQVLSHEMDAVWDFMERNQNQFKIDEDGNPTLYCVVAAKSISRSFTEKTDYLIHYTNVKTRKKADSPDAFELEAMEAFQADPELKTYSALTTGEDGSLEFRYVEPLYVTESCLDCHGEPAGELDSLGYPKEGQKIGDMAGVASIIMPADAYLEGAQTSFIQETIVFALVVVGSIAIIFFGLSVLVTAPLKRLEEAAQKVGKRDFDICLEEIGDRDEVEDLATHFTSMTTQLKELYENLEDQVKTRTVELVAANEMLEFQRSQLEDFSKKLQDESRYKSDFLAIMSHELRTPLTSILAFTELWESSARNESEEAQIAVAEIKENGRILLQMVNNILEMARLEEGKTILHREAIDLNDLIDVVLGTVGFLAEKRAIRLTTKVDAEVPVITADFEKLRRIVENLASNAIKFTQPGGSVDIEVQRDDACPEEVVIRVSDTGVGIKPEDIPCIFDRFSQGDQSSSLRYGGSGLGLAVVKELVELHGGRIEVASRQGEGSSFAVHIAVGDGGWDVS